MFFRQPALFLYCESMSKNSTMMAIFAKTNIISSPFLCFILSDNSKMLTLFALKQSRAYRIAWLLELLNVEYHVQLIERDVLTHLAPLSLRTVHPLGKSPLIQDDDSVIAESGAICEYLLAKYDVNQYYQIPAEHADYWAYRQWLHYAEGSLMPLLVMSLVLDKVDEKPVPFFVRPVASRITNGVRAAWTHPQLKLHLDYVEQQLNGKTWLVGQKITAADVMMSFPLQAVCAQMDNTLVYPNIAAYVARIVAEPHYQKAEEKLGRL